VTAALRLVRDDGSDGQLPPIEAYELYMRAGNRSDRYISDSLATLCKLQLQADKPVKQCTPVDVSRYLAVAHYGPATRSVYFGHIRGFFRWWALEGGADITSRLPRPKVPKREPRPVSKAGLRQLLDTNMHERTRIMILLAVLAGLRVHEIAKFRGEDIDLDRARCASRARVAALTRSRCIRCSQSRRPTPMPRRGWWYPSNNRRPGEHVHSKGVSDIIGNAMRRAGVPGTPHSLRHSYGTQLVAGGVDLRTAQTLLRHTNLQTTAIYVQVADERRAEAIDRLDPFG
jgi:integrase/recombinase XerD